MAETGGPCPHDTITKQPVMSGHGFVWVCDGCSDLFIPVDAVQRIEEQSANVLDTVTAVFSATLWDLHQRVLEAHAIAPPDRSPVAVAVCEEVGHDRGDDGTCKRCTDNPFLGGQEK